MRQILFFLLIVFGVSNFALAQAMTAQEKAAAQAAFEQIDAGLMVMTWTYGASYTKPDLEKLSTLISAKGIKVFSRSVIVKSSANPKVVKDSITEKIYAAEKFREAIRFQIKFTDQYEANPEKMPAQSKDPLLLELNNYFSSYRASRWLSRGAEGEEEVETQRKSVGEWAWAVQHSKTYKIKDPMINRVRLVKEGKDWKLSEIHIAEITHQK